MNIHIFENETEVLVLSVEQLQKMAPHHFTINERVPGIEGRAFDLATWYESWSKKSTNPTHIKVEAVDEFQAMIPWDELDSAAILYEQNEKPLKKGFPIRLYVPDGSSDCLNVKSIVKIFFIRDQSLGNESSFGFKNTLDVSDLGKQYLKKKSE
ncbi:hypothetical protein [Chengkuizengella axinellae]|uniref:Oxidoreductase molybdopterin-binding domain-containing protein n=1 Tax=Chengkuizengella axinellae TaxID=3064388 RepID=A0ABT9J0D2_9BACL|nr:hypothetical protein [Chengkuizengella sp. 2205SS18-9]MDP5275081.1 hypothetical protein [Chengkuizengella sp. 2205SS18-9]